MDFHNCELTTSILVTQLATTIATSVNSSVFAGIVNILFSCSKEERGRLFVCIVHVCRYFIAHF